MTEALETVQCVFVFRKDGTEKQNPHGCADYQNTAQQHTDCYQVAPGLNALLSTSSIDGSLSCFHYTCSGISSFQKLEFLGYSDLHMYHSWDVATLSIVAEKLACVYRQKVSTNCKQIQPYYSSESSDRY